MSKVQTKWLADAVVKLVVESKTANFNAASGYMYAIAPAGATLSVQLPAPSASAYIVLKDMSNDMDTKTTTIVRNSTELIDGVAANKTLTSEYQSMTLVSDGTNWYII